MFNVEGPQILWHIAQGKEPLLYNDSKHMMMSRRTEPINSNTSWEVTYKKQGVFCGAA
jgi:hypothetical protein